MMAMYHFSSMEKLPDPAGSGSLSAEVTSSSNCYEQCYNWYSESTLMVI